MPKNFFQKFVVCFLAGLVTGRVVMRIGQRFLFPWIPPVVMLALGLLILMAALSYPFAWNRFSRGSKKYPAAGAGTKGEPGEGRTERIFSCWVGIIRYGVALDLIMVGLQKWFHLQFNTPIAKLDLPFSSFSSEDLSWAFFGHSRGFIMVIGGLQILGSIFLLFNRSRLLGTVVLIPVMLNITLMDLFYHFNVGEWLSALILLTALVYLLLLDYEKLAAVFLAGKGSHPARVFKNQWVKNAARSSAVLIPLAMICVDPNPYRHDRFMGKYEVEHLSVNNQPLKAGSCMDSVLTFVYFDQGNECVFECNGPDRRLFGIYRYNEAKGQITVAWHYPKAIRKDTLYGSLHTTLSDEGSQTAVTAGTQTVFTLSGKMGKDLIQADLRKVD